jgi:hypothetical protein
VRPRGQVLERERHSESKLTPSSIVPESTIRLLEKETKSIFFLEESSVLVVEEKHWMGVAAFG